MTKEDTFHKTETWTTQVYKDRKPVAMVQIKHWIRPSYEAIMNGSDEVVNHWNVYATLWPEHSMFERSSEATEQDYMSAGLNLPFHGGQTYHRRYYDEDGEVVAVEMGSDYAHYGDERFESYTTLSDAVAVEMDARELLTYLQESA